MTDKSYDLYFELFRRTLDDRRYVIVGALTATLGFAVSVIQYHLNGKCIISVNPYAWGDFTALSSIFILVWVLYFAGIIRMTSRIQTLAKKLSCYTLVDPKDLSGLYDVLWFCGINRMAVVPFAISMFIYIIVVFPFGKDLC